MIDKIAKLEYLEMSNRTDPIVKIVQALRKSTLSYVVGNKEYDGSNDKYKDVINVIDADRLIRLLEDEILVYGSATMD